MLKILTILATIALCLGCNQVKTSHEDFRVIHLRGSHYEMGFQHGTELSSEIHAIYTRYLTCLVYPYINREGSTFNEYFSYYQDDRFEGSKFSYEFLKESSLEMENHIPPEYLEEIRGIADGAGMDYEDILILNTFLDALLNTLVVKTLLINMEAPHLTSFRISDGIDNDGDGEVDEIDENRVPFESQNTAVITEIPLDSEIIVEFEDPSGVDPCTVRVELNGNAYGVDCRVDLDGNTYMDCSAGLSFEEFNGGLRVKIKPPEGLPPASVVIMEVIAGDFEQITKPPPVHANFSRKERLVFSTAGYEKGPEEIPNINTIDTRGVASSYTFGVKDSFTKDNKMYVGRTSVLLDSDVAHDHTALIVYHPDNESPHVVLSWAGVIWGLTGMNDRGKVVGVNYVDTLNNAMIGSIIKPLISSGIVTPSSLRKKPNKRAIDKDFLIKLLNSIVESGLLTSGIPMGIIGRKILANDLSITDTEVYLKGVEKTFGWNVFMADGRENEMGVFELDSNLLDTDDKGVHFFSNYPQDNEDMNSEGVMSWSITHDDLRCTSHFMKNTNEINHNVLGFSLKPQRFWAGGFFNSLNSFYTLGNLLDSNRRKIDLETILKIMRNPFITDIRNSMHSAVFLPGERTIHVSMGSLPSNRGHFQRFDAEELGFVVN